MEKEAISILKAIREENLLVSVRRNRFYGLEESHKANFKLVLAITVEKQKGDLLLQRLRTRIPSSEVLIESFDDRGVSYMLIYCKDSDTVSNISTQAFPTKSLRSNVNYEEKTFDSLYDQAKMLD